MTIDLSLRWQVLEGDNAAYRHLLPRDAALVSDPPYGMNWNPDSTRFSNGGKDDWGGRADWKPVAEDDRPFDPSPWLDFRAVVLFGANHYAQRLPVGTTLVWVKRAPHNYGTFLSDAEIAWMKGGHGVYCFEAPFPNMTRAVEGGGSVAHPTQKSVALMEWCIGRLNLEPDSLIIDPYCGSGTTGVAAVNLGHRFLGIEREPSYVAIARRRIADAAAQGNLFG